MPVHFFMRYLHNSSCNSRVKDRDRYLRRQFWPYGVRFALTRMQCQRGKLISCGCNVWNGKYVTRHFSASPFCIFGRRPSLTLHGDRSRTWKKMRDKYLDPPGCDSSVQDSDMWKCCTNNCKARISLLGMIKVGQVHVLMRTNVFMRMQIGSVQGGILIQLWRHPISWLLTRAGMWTLASKLQLNSRDNCLKNEKLFLLQPFNLYNKYRVSKVKNAVNADMHVLNLESLLVSFIWFLIDAAEICSKALPLPRPWPHLQNCCQLPSNGGSSMIPMSNNEFHSKIFTACMRRCLTQLACQPSNQQWMVSIARFLHMVKLDQEKHLQWQEDQKDMQTEDSFQELWLRFLSGLKIPRAYNLPSVLSNISSTTRTPCDLPLLSHNSKLFLRSFFS